MHSNGRAVRSNGFTPRSNRAKYRRSWPRFTCGKRRANWRNSSASWTLMTCWSASSARSASESDSLRSLRSRCRVASQLNKLGRASAKRPCQPSTAHRRFDHTSAEEVSAAFRQYVTIDRSRFFAHAPRQVLQPQARSEEHTSELQSLRHLVCRLLL